MADSYISTSTLSNAVTAAIDKYVRAELRHMPLLRAIADTRPVDVDRPGSSVALYTRGDLSPSTTPLSETTDPDAVALPNPTATTLTPYEYGNVTIASMKVGATSFFDVDSDQVDAIAWNMRDTLDVLVRDALDSGTNVRYVGGHTADNQITTSDTITSNDIRYCVTKMRGNAAQGKMGDLYGCWIHPDVSFDFRANSAAGQWQDLHKYEAPGMFWPGQIGVYEGAFFIESARTKITADGVSSIPVYHTIVAGREALAEGVVIEPEVRRGVIPDKLNRFHPLGWYGFLGWTVFRNKALYNVRSTTSIPV